SLAATAADAERDYRRVIVEYPFSAHAGDALLALAQLEMARGDRTSATEHLQRFLLEHNDAPERARAGLWLGRLLLEQNQLPRGCAVLLRTRAQVPATQAELRNQIDYYATRCAGVDTVSAPAAGRAPSAARAPAAGTPGPAPRAAPSAAPTTPAIPATVRRYTVQVAAYASRAAAEQLVARLKQRGISARVVSPGTAPFRVRVGLYATEREAGALARELAAKGIEGFVTAEVVEAGREPR
ncbi:MAG TPA: SPOR domain-containing protein, partial [Gemmatimonadaceae bacterium]|nr:SPOR domain-containing protein [Gemmatimonadaceae bacterium]